MASRYPLVVNTDLTDPRIEELRDADDLDMSLSLIEGTNGLPTITGANSVLRYDGAGLEWINAYDLALNINDPTDGTTTLTNRIQTLTNKTIDGVANTLQNIPTSALSTGFITFGGTQVFLGDSIPAIDTDTRYQYNASQTVVNEIDVQLSAFNLDNAAIVNPAGAAFSSLKFQATGATTLVWNSADRTLIFNSTDTDTNTTYASSGSGGLDLNGTLFSLKNSGTFADQTVLRWDDGNSQFINTNITDTGSLITLNSDAEVTNTLKVSSTATSANLIVGNGSSGSREIQIRSGNSIARGNSIVKAVATTDAGGAVLRSADLRYDVTGAGPNFEQSGWQLVDEDGNDHFLAHNDITNLPPANNTSPGRAGQIRFDSTNNFIYFCLTGGPDTAGQWLRVNLAAGTLDASF